MIGSTTAYGKINLDTNFYIRIKDIQYPKMPTADLKFTVECMPYSYQNRFNNKYEKVFNVSFTVVYNTNHIPQNKGDGTIITGSDKIEYVGLNTGREIKCTAHPLLFNNPGSPGDVRYLAVFCTTSEGKTVSAGFSYTIQGYEWYAKLNAVGELSFFKDEAGKYGASKLGYVKPDAIYFGNISTAPWLIYKEQIKKVTFNSLNMDYVSTFRGWFENCIYLETVSGKPIMGRKTTNNMNYMFANCKSLISLPDGFLENNSDSGSFSCEYMFHNCKSITKINLGYTNIYNGSYAFAECDNLVTVRFFGFIGGQCDSMFSWCPKLENINLSFFSTKQAASDTELFAEDISLPNFDEEQIGLSKAKFVDSGGYFKRILIVR